MKLPRTLKAMAWLAPLVGLSACQSLDPSARLWIEEAGRRPGEVDFVRLNPERVLAGMPQQTHCVAATAAHWIRPGLRERRVLRGLFEDRSWDRLGDTWVLLVERYRLWAAMASYSEDELQVRIAAGVPVILILPAEEGGAGLRCVVAVGYDRMRQVFALWQGESAVAEMAREELAALRKSTAALSILLCPVDAWGWALTSTEFRARARSLELLGETARAESDYRQLLLLEPNSAYPAWKIGNLRRSAGLSLEAEHWYRHALARDDGDASAYNNLAFLLAELGVNVEEAISLARQAVFLDPSSPLPLDTLGYALYRKGAYEEAAGVLERARGRARGLSPPEQAAIAIHLALAQLGAQQVHLVRQVVSQAVRIHPQVQLPPELRPYRPQDLPTRK